MALIIIDIDYFKKINDSYGHIFSDYVLKKIREILLSRVGEKGSIARWSGEEFVIFLPAMNQDDVYNLAEHIREDIKSYHFFWTNIQSKLP
jgi:two-component system cell cycle response regulator